MITGLVWTVIDDSVWTELPENHYPKDKTKVQVMEQVGVFFVVYDLI